MPRTNLRDQFTPEQRYRVTFVLADDPIPHVFGYLTGASAAMLALIMLRRRFYGCRVYVVPTEPRS